MLCDAAYIIVGTVQGAHPEDCRIDLAREGKAFIDCGPKDLVKLNVVVTQVIGEKREVRSFPGDLGVTAGREIALVSALYNSMTSPAFENYDRIGVVPPTPDPVTQEKISEIFIGKEFIFSIHIRRGRMWKDGQVIDDYLDEPPYYSGAWNLARAEWISAQLMDSAGNSCARLTSR
jgi:hypothetical protein